MTNDDDMDEYRVIAYWRSTLQHGEKLQDKGHAMIDEGIEMAALAGRKLREMGVDA
jgi:hypothetical protein